MSEFDLLKETRDVTRRIIIRELYDAAQSGDIEVFAEAFDRYDAFRALELASWQTIARDAINTQTATYIIEAPTPEMRKILFPEEG